MAGKKVTNFNAMRPVIIVAHNDGNTKAINQDMVKGAGIDVSYFTMWKSDCEKLRATVWDYVQKKKNSRFDATITEDVLYAARERIFPKWKEILSTGEAKKDTRELHVSERDVEDLVGFAWDFMATSHGTVEARTTEQIFRKKVESLLGCAIAKNEVLDDTDRDTLSAFYGAQRSIQKCIDKLAELEASIKNYKELATKTESEDFKAFLEKQIKLVETEVKAEKENKAKAEATQKEHSAAAQAIELKIRFAK